jgi:two-component system LytT family sensor kinase
MESHERKLDVNRVKRTFLDWLITQTSHLSLPVRIALHFITILLIASIDLSIVHWSVGDDWPVLISLSVLIIAQNLLIFYAGGYWVLPKLIYRKRLGWLTLLVVLTFWLAYLLNRTVIFTVEPTLTKSTQYITRIRAIIGPTGFLGCFTSLRVFLWNFAFAAVSPLIPLIVMTMQKTMVFRQTQFNLERNRLLLDRDNTLLKMNFLKAQVSPHFLFNTLNSIYARMVDVDDQAADLVLRLAELMRYNLYEANVARVPLSREVNYLKSYVALERARHGSRLSVLFNSPTATTDYLIAPLLLSTFVENAFKHGIKSGIDGSYIRIDAQLENNTLHFVIENSISNSVTMTTTRRAGGVGLPNVRKRLDLQYPDQYTLTHDTTDTYYRVTLRILLETISSTTSPAQTSAL